MKKFKLCATLLLAFGCMLGFAACGASNAQPSPQSAPQQQKQTVVEEMNDDCPNGDCPDCPDPDDCPNDDCPDDKCPDGNCPKDFVPAPRRPRHPTNGEFQPIRPKLPVRPVPSPRPEPTL